MANNEDNEDKVQRLGDAIVYLWPKVQPRLEQMKHGGEKLFARDDFVWQMLLNSMSTWGNSRYAELMEDEALYSTVVYKAMARISDDDERYEVLLSAFTEAGLRYNTDKAQYMTNNYKLIQEKGGVLEAKQEYLTQPDKKEKMRFWKAFHGIGDKYARNIPMDLYDEHFRDEVALDARLIGIACKLGFTDSEARSYDVMTPFFREVAVACNMKIEMKIELWDIDRVLYNYAPCVHLTLES